MKNEHLIINIQERVATITFNQPDKHNAIDYEGWKVLLEETRLPNRFLGTWFQEFLKYAR